MHPLDSALEFSPNHDTDFFAALPPLPAVFLLELHGDSSRPFLSRTADLRRRLQRLLGPPDFSSKSLNLRDVTARVRYSVTASAFEQSFLLYQHARDLYPDRYRNFLRLRPPAFLKVNLRNPYPRCYVTRRILNDGAFYFGPFHSRKSADAFAGEFLNLFRIRRCQIKILRDPSFPGCIYSEMKMCLAPCFAGCTKEEHDAEVSRVVSFLSSSGDSLTSEIGRERESASDALDFERASALHKRLEKVSEVLRNLPDVARSTGELDAVILQRAAAHQSAALFLIRSGILAKIVTVNLADFQSQQRSLESTLREEISAPASPSTDLATLADHLALISRWFSSNPREGEIFFASPSSSSASTPVFPYRRIIRACSRVSSS